VNAAPTIAAALLLGLAASVHCIVMCGGITLALGATTARGKNGRPQARLLLGYQLGRVASYGLAGLLFGTLAGGVIAWLDVGAVRTALRVVAAMAMVLVALAAFGVVDVSGRLAGKLWQRIAPLGRRLLPVTRLRHAVAFGLLWGWMPCGFVYSVLLLAVTTFDPLHAAATMAAFGLGTTPALLASAWGAGRVMHRFDGTLARRAAGAVLLGGAALTLAAPLLAGPEWHWLHDWLPYDCAPPAH
jgi:sulfite exporter TauE/SafE